MAGIYLATKGVLSDGLGVRLIYAEKIDVIVDVNNPFIALEIDDVKLDIDVQNVNIDIDVRDP